MKFNKKFTRRQFLKGSMMAGAYLAAGGAGALFKPGKAHAFATSPSLMKFIQPLRNPLTGGIPLAAIRRGQILCTPVRPLRFLAGQPLHHRYRPV